MAQTTPDASFGPFLVVADLPVTYFVDYVDSTLRVSTKN